MSVDHQIFGQLLGKEFEMPLDFNTKKKTRSKPRPMLRMLALAFVSTFVPDMSLAQADSPVTLQFEDGRGSLTGRLTAYRNDKWFMDTSVGQLVLDDIGITCVGEACPPGTGLDFQPGPVVLTSKDGSESIDGELIGIVEDQYVLSTAVGEQRIDVALVDCDGAACGGTASSAVAAADPENTDVELTNGSITLVGELLDVVDRSFILKERTMGDIRVSMAEFSCSGAACP